MRKNRSRKTLISRKIRKIEKYSLKKTLLTKTKPPFFEAKKVSFFFKKKKNFARISLFYFFDKNLVLFFFPKKALQPFVHKPFQKKPLKKNIEKIGEKKLSKKKKKLKKKFKKKKLLFEEKTILEKKSLCFTITRTKHQIKKRKKNTSLQKTENLSPLKKSL